MNKIKTIFLHKWFFFLVVLGPIYIIGPLAIFGYLPLGYDTVPFFAPLVKMTSQLVQNGEFPIWTDRIGLGYPLLASCQVPIMYPLFWMFFLSKNPESLISFYLFIHLMLAAFGGIFMGKRAGLSTQAAVLVGIVCSASLPIIGLLNRPAFACVSGYAPFIIGAAINRTKKINTTIFGISTGLALTISPETAIAYLIIGLFLMLFFNQKKLHTKTVFSSGLKVALLILVFSAPVIIPFFELLPWSERAEPLGDWRVFQNSILGVQLLQGLAPLILGAWPTMLQNNYLGDFSKVFDYTHILWLSSPFPGILSIVLSILCIFCYRRFRAIGVLLFLLLLMSMTSFVPGIFHIWNLPILSSVRFPAKAWQVGLPLLALLCGGGLDASRMKARKLRAVCLIFIVIIAAGIILTKDVWQMVFMALGTKDSFLDQLLTFVRPALIFSFISLCLFIGLTFVIKRKNLIIFLLVAACTETIIIGSGGVDEIDPPKMTALKGIKSHLVNNSPIISNYWNSENPLLSNPLNRSQRATLGHLAGGGNVILGYGFSLEQSYMGIKLNGISLLDDALFNNLVGRFKAMGSDALLIGNNFNVPSFFTLLKSWPQFGIALYVPKEKPIKISTAKNIIFAPTRPDLVSALQASALSLENTAIVEDELLNIPALLENGNENIEIISTSTTFQEYLVTSNHPVLLWTRYAAGPGFIVSIDGNVEKSLTVNGCLRGVIVPQGKHTIIWRNNYTSFWIGCFISLFSLIFLGLMFFNKASRV